MSQDSLTRPIQNTTELVQTRCNSVAVSEVLGEPVPSQIPAPLRHWSQRMPGEHAKAHRAFLDYAQSGPARSLRKLAVMYGQFPLDAQSLPPVRSFATISDWSTRFEWRRRSGEYDVEQQAKRIARMRTLQAQGQFQRAQQLTEDEWQLSHCLRRIANQMLAEPSQFFRITTVCSPARRDRKGKIIKAECETQIIELKLKEVVTAVKLASELGRLAAGLPLSNQRQDLDSSHLTDEQLFEILCGSQGDETGHNDFDHEIAIETHLA